MNTSPRRTLPFERKAMECPSGRERRREEDVALGLLLGENGLREFSRPVHHPDRGQEPRLNVLAPLVAQVVERHAELADERALDADGRHGIHDLPDRLVAPVLADERPHRLPVAIREVLVGVVAHLLDRRELAEQRRVAHPDVRDRAARPERQVLGHAFHEPGGRRHLGERLEPVARLAAREDVVLERVHHLVREHVLEAAVVAGEVHQHAMPRRFGDAARAFAEVARDVVLAEVRARREEHDRLLLAELMVQHAGEAGVRALRHAGRVPGRLHVLQGSSRSGNVRYPEPAT